MTRAIKKTINFGLYSANIIVSPLTEKYFFKIDVLYYDNGILLNIYSEKRVSVKIDYLLDTIDEVEKIAKNQLYSLFSKRIADILKQKDFKPTDDLGSVEDFVNAYMK